MPPDQIGPTMSLQLKISHGIRAVVSTRPSNRKLLLIDVDQSLVATLGFESAD